jgi:predicted nucleotidyltransferase
MHLSRTDNVADLPATDARELMRRFGNAQPESAISYWIDTGSRTDTEVARALADAGYLREYLVDNDGQTWWETTIKGNALAQASFGRPITRATAQRHLAAVIERAHRFNADESHLIEITELVVFGSYLDPDIQHLGDLDLGVAFHSRIPDPTGADGRTKILLSYAKASGRSFNTLLDQLFWPEQEALLTLRNRSGVINITVENVRTLTDRWELVYSYNG